MTDVRTTRIYKRLLPCIRKQDRKEFTRMFQMAADSQDYPPFLGYADGLSWGFTWDKTPQGHAYWEQLSAALVDAGHGDVA